MAGHPISTREYVQREVTVGWDKRKRLTAKKTFVVIEIRAFGALGERRTFRAEIPLCDCTRKVCGSDHTGPDIATQGGRKRREHLVDDCAARGKCHPYRNGHHPESIDALEAKLIRTYGKGQRVHTPTAPPGRWPTYTPTGKPEAIAAALLAASPERLTPDEVAALLPDETERVRAELAKAGA